MTEWLPRQKAVRLGGRKEGMKSAIDLDGHDTRIDELV